MRICKVCNEGFIPSKNNHMQLLCSVKCSKLNTSKIKREYYERNKQLVKDRAKIWSKNNPEKIAEGQRNYRKNNPERVKQLGSNYRLNNKEKIQKRTSEYNNTPERKLYMRKYRRNPEALKKECESSKRYYLKNRHIEKNGHLKRKYGITLDTFNTMLKSQNNVCAICKNPEIGIDNKLNKLKDLSVDHCHVTGKVRGLLCFKCNASLGKFKDSIELLQSAIDYLTKHKEDSNE